MANGQPGENTASVPSLAAEERKPEPDLAMDHFTEDWAATVRETKA